MTLFFYLDSPNSAHHHAEKRMLEVSFEIVPIYTAKCIVYYSKRNRKCTLQKASHICEILQLRRRCVSRGISNHNHVMCAKLRLLSHERKKTQKLKNPFSIVRRNDAHACHAIHNLMNFAKMPTPVLKKARETLK